MKLGRIAIVLAVLASTGCAGTVEDMARQTTPAVVDGAIDGVSDPANQRKLAYNLQEDAIEEAVKRATSGVLDGAMESLSEEERQERMKALMGEVQKMTNQMVASTLDTALTSMLSEKTEKRIRAMLVGIVADMIVTVTKTAKAELTPSDEGVEAMSLAARKVTKQVTLGFQDAIDETHSAKEAGALPKGHGSVLWAAGEVAESGNTLVYGLGGAIGALTIALVAMFFWFSRRFKSHKGELDKREEALVLLTEAIKSTEEKPWAGELQSALKQKLRDQNGGDYMRSLLEQRQDLRYRPKTA
jgi:hypothetical protein